MKVSRALVGLCGILCVVGAYGQNGSPDGAGEPPIVGSAVFENSKAVQRIAAKVLEESKLRGVSVPAISSNPGASFTIYLDFDGHNVPAWHDHPPRQAPAFDADGDPANFSLHDAWGVALIAGLVGEDFAPFNVNVTTVEPEPEALGKRRGVRVVIGGTGDWYDSAGIYFGISHSNDFYQEDRPTVFVSSDDIRQAEGRGEWYEYLDVANSASHETGHALMGLGHHGPMEPDREAIMLGSPMRVQARRNWTASDVASIALAFVSTDAPDGRRKDVADDYLGDALSGLSPLQGRSIIERIDDVDRFFFRAPGGRIIVNVSPMGTAATPFYANLDAKLQLCAVLTHADQIVLVPLGVGGDPRNSLGVTLTRRIPAEGESYHGFGVATGLYYAVVLSHGSEGDLGQYSVNIRHESP